MSNTEPKSGWLPVRALAAMKPPAAAEKSLPDWTGDMHRVASLRDREAFMRIYSFFGPRLCLYVRGLGAGNSVAEEISQDALLKLWQQATQYDAARGTLSTWLFRVARNLYFDKRRREHGAKFVDAAAIDSECDPIADRAEAYTDNVTLHQRIDALSPVQARLIRMSYFEAKSHQQIADEMGLPLGTVKSHVRRAFLALQSSIGHTQ